MVNNVLLRSVQARDFSHLTWQQVALWTLKVVGCTWLIKDSHKKKQWRTGSLICLRLVLKFCADWSCWVGKKKKKTADGGLKFNSNVAKLPQIQMYLFFQVFSEFWAFYQRILLHSVCSQEEMWCFCSTRYENVLRSTSRCFNCLASLPGAPLHLEPVAGSSASSHSSLMFRSTNTIFKR